MSTASARRSARSRFVRPERRCADARLRDVPDQSVPRGLSNREAVSFEVIMDLKLYDTTLRDGTQREGLSLSVEDKVKIARRLDELGIYYLEGGWPGSNPKDAEFFRRIPTAGLRRAKVAAFGMTRRAGGRAEDDANLRALVEAETLVVTLVGKTSALHVERVLETSRDENLRMIGDSVGYCKRLGREVIYDAEHFFDGCRLDLEYAHATLRAAADAGADCIVLCDTNGGELPEVVEQRVRDVRSRVATPLGIHTHNDSGLALANALAAVKAGCVHVQGTINGYGERCGNMDLIPLIATLQCKLGYNVLPPAQLGRLTDVAEGSFEMLVRRAAPDYKPPFELLGFTVLVDEANGAGVKAQATVKLRVGDEVVHTAAEGAGPVNALDCAVRKGLLPHYPELADVRLVDYKVRIVDEHLGTAAKPRVVLESARGSERWSTVGCSENIIEASWQALRDSLELPLLRARG